LDFLPARSLGPRRVGAALLPIILIVMSFGPPAASGQSTGSVVGWGQQVVVPPEELEGLVAIAGGMLHSLGLKSDGSIVAWGYNDRGQCEVPAPNVDLVAIAGGGNHSLGLKSDGSIVAWGDNTYVPTPNTDFVAISVGKYHSLALTTAGSIVAWGDNTYGQCDIPTPNTDFIAVTGGESHSLGLKSDGSIVAWGSNGYGQCNVPTPNADFVAIAGGGSHSLGLKSDGTIVAWGSNSYGQCNVPTPNTNFIAIAGGTYHSLGLKSDGSIVAWGNNVYDQCEVPTLNADFIAVAAGRDHSLGLKSDGTITIWGSNGFSQCNTSTPNLDFLVAGGGGYHSLGLKADSSIMAWGSNAFGQCDVPLPNGDFTALAGGGEHSLGLKSDGSIVAWGDNSQGQCDVPVQNTGFVAVAAGWTYSLGLKSDGRIVAWGENNSGQCDVPTPNADFVAIAAGFYHSLAVKSDGSIVAWGNNGSGQCDIPLPNADFIDVAGGWLHTLGLKSDGSIVAWGDNSQGQCDVPVQNTGFVAVAAGWTYSLGLKSDGSIVAWGNNNYGQCNVPTPNTDFIAIAAGWVHALAIRRAPSPPTSIALSTPADGSQVPTPDVSFSWEDVGADHYELWADDDADFSSPEIAPFHFEPFGADSLGVTSFPWGDGWLTPGNHYWKVRAYTGSSYVESDTWSFIYSPPVDTLPTWGPLYRLYKPEDKDHFYCTSEGHSAISQDSGYHEERVECWLSHRRFDSPGLVQLFRFYDDTRNCHYYTSLETRVDSLISAGLRYEGITGYAFANPDSGLVPLHHLSAPSLVDNLYTTSEIEREYVRDILGFQEEGVVAYVSPSGDAPSLPAHRYSGFVGAGISVATGNFQHFTKTSFDIPSVGLPLRFEHLYNSLGVHLPSPMMPLGPGWTHTYNAYVLTSVDQWLVVWPDGSVHRYSQATGECLDREYGVYDTMEVLPDGVFEITRKDHVVYRFERPAGTSTGYPSMLASIRDRNQNTIVCSYEPDGRHRLTAVTGPAGRQLSFHYTEPDTLKAHLITEVRDEAGGRSIFFAYADSSGNLTSYTDCGIGVTRYHYGTVQPQDHQLVSIVLPNGNRVDNAYEGRKITSQAFTGDVGSITLSAVNDSQTTVTDGAGRVFRFTRDPGDRVEKIENVGGPAGYTQVWREDPDNPALPTRVRDPRGNETSFTYDSRGNILSVQRPLGVVETFVYDSMNNITSHTDGNNHTTVFAYDSNGNLVSVTDPLSHTTTYTLLGNGLISGVTDPLGRQTSWSYDSHGNPTEVLDPLGNRVVFSYDGIGRMSSRTDPEGAVTNYAYDCQDHRTETSQAIAGVTSYAYDANGNLVSVTDALNHQTSFAYNDLDLLTSSTNPVGDVTSYAYDNTGLLQSRTRPTGVTSYGHDGAGRLQTISSSGAILTRDANGNIIGLSDDGGTMSYSYDALDRLVGHTDYFGNTVGYQYDAAGNLTTLSYAPGKDVNYTYDSDDRLHTITDWLGHTTTCTYRADGSVQSIQYPNGTRAEFSYDGAGRLATLTHMKSDLTVIAAYAITRDGRGYPVSVTRDMPLSSPPRSPEDVTLLHDEANRLTSAGPVGYAYDGAGNMISRTGASPLSCTYDLENRLTAIGGSASAGFLYDTFGNRRQATRNGVTTRYILDVRGMGRVLVETDATGVPLRHYVHGLGLTYRINSDGSIHCFHADHTGNIVALTDAAQSVTHAYVYDAFGGVLDSTEADENLFRFGGCYGVMAEEGGLYFMRARYYDPEAGRFLGEDPLWSPNLYVYAENTPLVMVDPGGTWPSIGSWLMEFGANIVGGAAKVTYSVTSKTLSAVTLWASLDSWSMGTQPTFDRRNAVNARINSGKLDTVSELELMLENRDINRAMFTGDAYDLWQGVPRAGIEYSQSFAGW